MDKDFSYIDVLLALFPGCNIFLCSVHVERYIREKVLPSARDVGGGVVDKPDILNKFKSLRDSHTEEQYEERKQSLFEATENILVRPGGVKTSSTFQEYFLRNWDLSLIHISEQTRLQSI